MKRTYLTVAFALTVLIAQGPSQALAQDEPPPEEPTGGTPEGGGEAAPTEAPPADEGTSDESDFIEEDANKAASDAELKTSTKDVAPQEDASAPKKTLTAQERWKDIMVVQRKSFLKRQRVELMPFYGTTINDNMIQHSALGGELNYFLTDILSVGVLGMYYFSNVSDQEFLSRYHFQRIPSLNRYKYTATLNFSYVPIYAKSSIYNNHMLHYEVFVTAGAGISGTEVIPRSPENEPFSNIALTFNAGAGGRIFLTRWLAAQVAIRSFMMLDKFENIARKEISGADAKKNAETSFINNMIFNVGLSVFFPMDFKYTTYR